MEIVIVCPACQGSGLRVTVVGYSGSDLSGEMVVPRRCTDCSGSGRRPTPGWGAAADPGDDAPGSDE
ncbi:hypothetical protein [Nocardiopsis trehalosi]|uniref:hypothetical protein n=1 Tax=Nocardiopsis trehalosi TaxID=109329 RepID=UPI0008334736|nr:hypothetical protein [Nocardiopsis trehalosi]